MILLRTNHRSEIVMQDLPKHIDDRNSIREGLRTAIWQQIRTKCPQPFSRLCWPNLCSRMRHVVAQHPASVIALQNDHGRRTGSTQNRV